MSGRHHTDQEEQPTSAGPLRRHPAVVGAVLGGLIVGVLGIAGTVLTDSDSDSGSTSIVVPPSSDSDPGVSEEGDPEAPGAEGDAAEEETPPAEGAEPPSDPEPLPEPELPPLDGNSHAGAKHLIGNRPVNTSITAGNDVDWWVYRAPEPQTATIEVTKYGGNVEFGTLLVAVFEGGVEVAEEAVTSEEPPLSFSRSVSEGTRLFVKVIDGCGGEGCAIGRYTVIARTAPAG